MPLIRYTATGDGVYSVAGVTFVPGADDEHDVPDDTAQRLTATPEFEYVAETCDEVMSNGEVCGRQTPCSYHSDDED